MKRPRRTDPPNARPSTRSAGKMSTARQEESTAPVAGEPVPAPEAPADKYAVGREIGRGGLGRVIEAEDAHLGRTVALKLILGDAAPEVRARFQWEARVTGRLEHPNIVPVHEVGRLAETGELFIAMKRIAGRNLSVAIREFHKGAGTWTLRRLVEVFRDVCRAAAYAHSKSVVHRDLKPANVMLGDFGEVLVVDWGLAKVLVGGESEGLRARGPEGVRGPDRKAPGDSLGELKGARRKPVDSKRSLPQALPLSGPKPLPSSDASGLTMEGDLLGTPAYMPPEQAMGQIAEVDERSDVYALGAILYEILAGRPPIVTSETADLVDAIVRTPVEPPSRWKPAPAELEAVAMRALSKSKRQRFASVLDLETEITAFLEGTRERERRAAMADERAARGAKERERWVAVDEEAARADEVATRERRALPVQVPEVRRRAVWELEDRARRLRRESAEAFAEADALLVSALSILPDHAEARRERAELWWRAFEQAEAAGDEAAMIRARHIVEHSHDGALASRLRGDGTLAVRAVAFVCGCLARGRDVAPAELNVHGYHPWSGRPLEGRRVDYAKSLEGSEPARLRVHAASCRAVPLVGAHAWAFRYEERDRLLYPVTPDPHGEPVPSATLDALFGASPFRPAGPGRYLGTLPLAPCAFPMGSWLLVIEAPGRVPMRLPVFISRGESVTVNVPLFREDEVPSGFLPVGGGRFRYQGDPRAESGDMEILEMQPFFISRLPVTCAEYRDDLNLLLASHPGEARRRGPRLNDVAPSHWPCGPNGYVLPDAEWRTTASPEDIDRSCFENGRAPWRADWPVVAITWEDASSYALRASARTGFLMHLFAERQFEAAARGADGRPFPWGHHCWESLSNQRDTFGPEARPVSVHDFPHDESPWGVRGLGGNAGSWALDDGGAKLPQYRVIRGGAWYHAVSFCRAAKRSGNFGNNATSGAGMRLTAAVRLTTC